uniref:Carboxylic ester hydrolase n=1 Tax=Loxostege sticticalis TaxID=481309 RepID=B3TNN2_LOXSC|nr:carboxylesterase [Loxostege sticticalis]
MVAAGVSQDTGITNTPSKRVRTQGGYIEGFRNADYDVYEFFNVPYASVPRGRDKFKAPLPPPMWFGDRPARDEKIICPQPDDPMNAMMTQQEDCLIANIHVPNTDETNLPVMVFIHGGAYLFGWGAMDRPNGLVSSKNVIAVTFNYRLGPHGFLCLGNEDAPGNAGMKDQVQLLRWVRTNIANFGGNPGDVTIIGCSAGGSSVDLLMLSNMANGLFNKVIAESGSSLNIFAVQLNPLQNARNYALRLGWTTENVMDLAALAELYKTRDINDLFDASLVNTTDSYFVFQPCVETFGQQRFLEDTPYNILRSGNFRRYPVIYGYTKHEGLLRLQNFDEWSVAMNTQFSDFLPADLQFDNDEQKQQVADTVKEFYFGDKLVDTSTVMQYVDYFSDVIFIGGIMRTVAFRVQAGHNDTFLYEYSFTHDGSTSIPQVEGLNGADHCDQYGVILDHTGSTVLSAERLRMSETMRDIIYNFITTGNPTPESVESTLPTWPPVGFGRTPYYSVGSTIEVSEDIPIENRTLFWDGIYQRYGGIELPEPTPDATESTPQETASTPTPEDGSASTPQDGTDSTQDGTDSTAEDATEPSGPNSATLTAVFSSQFWVFYSVVILLAFK